MPFSARVSQSAFAAIQPVGRPSRGKKQLRFEEAERFFNAGFALFDKQQDSLAPAAVTTLLLGCRVSEVVHLKVRDLDCGPLKARAPRLYPDRPSWCKSESRSPCGRLPVAEKN